MGNRRRRKKIILAVLAILIAVPVIWFIARRVAADYIPRADRSDIGEVVTLSFPELLAANPYEGNLSPELMDHMSFVYVFDSQMGKGKLTVFSRVAGNKTYCCVTVYEPEWVGGEGLCQNLTGSFQARVVARKNISSEDGLFLVHNITRYTGGSEPLIQVGSHREIDSPNLQWFMGVMDPTPQSARWNTLDGGICVSVKLGTEEASDTNDVNALIDILDRYKLYKKVIPDDRK